MTDWQQRSESSNVIAEHTSQFIYTYSTPGGDSQEGSRRGNQRPRRHWRRPQHHWLSRKSHAPAPAFNPEHGDSAVRVAVALNGGKPGGKHFDPQRADGTAPGSLVYNPDYDYLGHSDWKQRPHIASSSYTDLII